MIQQKSIDDIWGIPSAHDSDRRYTPYFNGTERVCNSNKGPCEHWRRYHTPCRHIFQMKLQQKGKYQGGVRETSLESYRILMNDPDSLREIYKRILVALWELGKPSSDREICRHLGEIIPNRIRPRRNALTDPDYFYHPLVRDSGGKRKCTVPPHRTVSVWELTEEGRIMVKENYI